MGKKKRRRFFRGFHCSKCSLPTFRIVHFIAKLWYHPELRLGEPPKISIPLCSTCERLRQLPVVDMTNHGIVDWFPWNEVATEVTWCTTV